MIVENSAPLCERTPMPPGRWAIECAVLKPIDVAPAIFRTRVITDGVTPSLHVDYKHTTIKQYHKEGRALRTETTINDTRDFEIGKRLTNLPALREVGFSANRRLLRLQRLDHDPSTGADTLTAVTGATVTNSGARIPGLRSDDLTSFPTQVLPAGTALYRLHRTRRSPWWFSCDGSGRFDLAAPHGTCYLAEGPLAALLEVTRGLTILSEAFLADRSLLTTTLDDDLRLAELTAPAAYAFGVTGELSATSDYAGPQAWAERLHGAGFHGVRYHMRHDPRGALAGVAWFGQAGTLAHPTDGYSQALPAELLLSAAPFGIRIAGGLPTES